MTSITLYRPSKDDRGKGTYDETLGDPTTIYGVVEVHQSTIVLIVDRNEDVQPEDQIAVDGAAYRVTDSVWQMAGQFRSLVLERVDKPIFPITIDSSS